MKLINKTVYDSDQLRELFKLCLEAFHGDPKKTVRVAYSRRGGGIGGHAPLGRAGMHSARGNRDYYARQGHERGYLMIALPGPSFPLPNLHELAHVFEHELAHNRGLQHSDMAPRVMYWDKQPFAFVERLVANGFRLKRKEDPSIEYRHYCRVEGQPPITREQIVINVGLYGEHAKTSCAAIVEGPSSWRPSSNVGPWLCGYRLYVKTRKKLEAKIVPVARLDAAREARAKLAEKREARLRASLENAEATLHTMTNRVRKLRKKVAYYDRKAAKPPERS